MAYVYKAYIYISTKMNLILLNLLVSLLLVNKTFSVLQKTILSKQFVLVHGACHGAWSWYKLVPLLRSSGYNVTVIDLAASGIDPQQVNTLRSISEYHQPLMQIMESLPPHEKVILVGHSFGGLALTQAMERFPSKISVAVFVTASMPGPSLNYSTFSQQIQNMSRHSPQLDRQYIFSDGPNNPPTALIIGPIFMSQRMYQLSPVQDWALATTLVRPIRVFSKEDLSRELILTSEKYGSVKRVFIVAEKDLTIETNVQKWMIEKNPPNEVGKISGADHMVMMSKPKKLFALMLGIAKKYQ